MIQKLFIVYRHSTVYFYLLINTLSPYINYQGKGKNYRYPIRTDSGKNTSKQIPIKRKWHPHPQELGEYGQPLFCFVWQVMMFAVCWEIQKYKTKRQLLITDILYWCGFGISISIQSQFCYPVYCFYSCLKDFCLLIQI